MKPCEKYKLDLLDYATGETTFLTKEKQEQLFDHLRKCAVCRKAFYDYGSIYALAVTEAHTQQPEFRKRMDALIEQFKSSAQVKPALTDVKLEIDTAAGEIRKVLKTHGETPLLELRQKTGLLDYPFYEAMSWLVMNDEAIYTKDQNNRPIYVSPR